MAKKKHRNRPKRAAADKPADKPAKADTASEQPATTEPAREALPADGKAARMKPAATKPAKRSSPTRAALPADGFWTGFEVTWAKLALARVAVFGLLAVDALLQIRHAPRYGVNGFNVGQLGLLDDLGPGRVAYGACELVIAYLLVLAVFGIATRVVIPIAAALYAWLYFGSQLDSYQHHYLVALLLVIASFVPWKRPADAEPTTPVRSWALRLFLVQIAIMYLWAAISKLDPAWLDGRTLGSQIGGSMRSVIEGTVGFKVVSVLVIGVELVLAATVWSRRTWRIAAPLGILFHAGIVMTQLEIGVFAYLMVALYILIVPDRIWVRLAELAPAVRLRARAHAFAERTSWGALAAALVAGLAIAMVIRIPNAFVVAAIACVAPLAIVNQALRTKRPPTTVLALAHVIAIASWLAVDRTSTIAIDYYRFWGNSEQRLNHKDTAERVYRSLVDIAPALGHLRLGEFLLATGRANDGLAELHAAQEIDSADARSWVAEARWLATQPNRKPDAIAKAKEAVFADPNSKEARALLASLTGTAAPPRSGDDDDTDTQ